MLRSRVMPSFAYLECHCSLFRRTRSQTCLLSVTTLLSSYLCTRTLAIGSCKSEKRAARLCWWQPLILDLNLWHRLFLTTIMVDHYPLFEFACSKILQLVALCYVALASPPRHQHLRCFHFYYVVFMFLQPQKISLKCIERWKLALLCIIIGRSVWRGVSNSTSCSVNQVTVWVCHTTSLSDRILSVDVVVNYRIAGNFRGTKYSWFSNIIETFRG